MNLPKRPRRSMRSPPSSGHASPDGDAGLLAAHLLLGPGQVTLERLVELLHGLDPAELALLDLVEVVLHLGGEGHVHDVAEERHQLVGHGHAELGREQRAPLAVDVAAVVDDRGQDRGVGGRPADPQLLQGLDERGLGEARRRLGEVLLGIEAQQRQHLALLQRRHRALGVLVGGRVFLLAALHVDRREALELHRLALGAEHGVAGRDVGRHGVVHGRHQLAGHEALPDQPIERELVLGERAGHAARVAAHVARAGWPRGPPGRCRATCRRAAPPAGTRRRSARSPTAAPPACASAAMRTESVRM